MVEQTIMISNNLQEMDIYTWMAIKKFGPLSVVDHTTQQVHVFDTREGWMFSEHFDDLWPALITNMNEYFVFTHHGVRPALVVAASPKEALKIGMEIMKNAQTGTEYFGNDQPSSEDTWKSLHPATPLDHPRAVRKMSKRRWNTQ